MPRPKFDEPKDPAESAKDAADGPGKIGKAVVDGLKTMGEVADKVKNIPAAAEREGKGLVKKARDLVGLKKGGVVVDKPEYKGDKPDTKAQARAEAKKVKGAASGAVVKAADGVTSTGLLTDGFNLAAQPKRATVVGGSGSITDNVLSPDLTASAPPAAPVLPPPVQPVVPPIPVAPLDLTPKNNGFARGVGSGGGGGGGGTGAVWRTNDMKFGGVVGNPHPQGSAGLIMAGMQGQAPPMLPPPPVSAKRSVKAPGKGTKVPMRKAMR